jgi:hypothetical protein
MASAARRGLKVVVVTAALMFFLAMLVRFTVASIQQTGWWNPLIACPQFEVRLGSIPADSVHTCEFHIQNRGSRSLTIERIRVGCASCLSVVESPRRPLAPGESGTIVAEFRSAGTLGPVVRTLAVHSNDPLQPSLVLKIIAVIQAPDSRARHTETRLSDHKLRRSQ